MREPAADSSPSYVVIGTSAGGNAALARIFKDLPADLPAAVLVVMHVPASLVDSALPRQLAGFGRLPVRMAADGEPIEQGTAYIAPSATHLLVEDGRIRLGAGPPEQHARPAIDVLFRSAAEAFGPHVIGVVLTGMGKDGAARVSSRAGLGEHLVSPSTNPALHGMNAGVLAGNVTNALPSHRV